jgi:nucleotide-binding universal stress UspA family protein
LYSHIVVPVDGSDLSESVLPWAYTLAKVFKSKIVLVEAITAGDAAGDKGKEEAAKSRSAIAKARRKENAYLSSLDQRLQGVEIAHSLKAGRPENVIPAEAKRHGDSTLIAMSTHGRSGIGRWLLGSVTDKVIHSAPCSMLVIRPKREDDSKQREAKLSRIILPLDGSELSEAAIPAALELAKTLNLPVTVARVVPTAQFSAAGEWSAGYAGGYAEVLEAVEGETKEYLAAKVSDLKRRGIARVDSKMFLGDPAGHIVDLGREREGSLVIMSSRGRTGLGRAILGSVADRVVSSSGAPVLLVKA